MVRRKSRVEEERGWRQFRRLETASVSTAVMTRSETGYFSGLIIAS